MSELEFKRAVADHSGTCQPCQKETNRLVAFRERGKSLWDALFLCDDCLANIQQMLWRRPSDA